LTEQAASIAVARPLELGADALLEVAGREQAHGEASAAAQTARVAAREVDRARPVGLAVLLRGRDRDDVAPRIVRLGRRRRTELDQIAVERIVVLVAAPD